MLVLDTDLLTLVQRKTAAEYVRLNDRLEAAAATEVIGITIVSFEEQTRGWLSYIARARTEQERIAAYRRLHELLEDFKGRTVVDYDEPAAEVCQQLVKPRIRIGTMDLRIAAIVLVNDATLLSRNLKDFGKVPGLRVEDWTKE